MLAPYSVTSGAIAFQESLISDREQDIRDIETGIQELNEVFHDLNKIIGEQGEMIGKQTGGIAITYRLRYRSTLLQTTLRIMLYLFPMTPEPEEEN
jgi:hypothetical protein